MGLLDKIKSALNLNSEKKAKIEALRNVLLSAIADGIITNQEMAVINTECKASGLSPSEITQVCCEAYNSIVSAALADRRVTEHEASALQEIARKLRIPAEVRSQSMGLISSYRTAYEIECGNLPVVNPGGVVMKRGEVAHWIEPATLLEEKTVSRKYVGGSHGVSFRIMKGVSYRIGASRGRMVSETGIVPVANGYFVITNQRLVFSGDRKSVNAPYTKILDMSLYTDGLNFSLTSRQKPILVKFSNSQNGEIVGALVSYALNHYC